MGMKRFKTTGVKYYQIKGRHLVYLFRYQDISTLFLVLGFIGTFSVLTFSVLFMSKHNKNVWYLEGIMGAGSGW